MFKIALLFISLISLNVCNALTGPDSLADCAKACAQTTAQANGCSMGATQDSINCLCPHSSEILSCANKSCAFFDGKNTLTSLTVMCASFNSQNSSTGGTPANNQNPTPSGSSPSSTAGDTSASTSPSGALDSGSTSTATGLSSLADVGASQASATAGAGATDATLGLTTAALTDASGKPTSTKKVVATTAAGSSGSSSGVPSPVTGFAPKNEFGFYLFTTITSSILVALML